MNLKVNYADKSNYGGSRKASAIKYIVIHYTANDGDHDESNAKYFKTKGRGASAHYFVDDDSVTISVPDLYVAWSVGGSRYANYKTTGGASLYKKCTNANSINVEMCDTLKNGKHDVSEATLANTIELVKELMAKYKVPTANVIRHFDVTGKVCPAYFATSGSAAWANFKARLISNSYMSKGLDYSSVFNAGYYRQKYADLANAFGSNATLLFNHFLNNGMAEGRQGSSEFNVLEYKKHYSDLQGAFGNNLPMYYRHYIERGKAEGRKGV